MIEPPLDDLRLQSRMGAYHRLVSTQACCHLMRSLGVSNIGHDRSTIRKFHPGRIYQASNSLRCAKMLCKAKLQEAGILGRNCRPQWHCIKTANL